MVFCKGGNGLLSDLEPAIRNPLCHLPGVNVTKQKVSKSRAFKPNVSRNGPGILFKRIHFGGFVDAPLIRFTHLFLTSSFFVVVFLIILYLYRLNRPPSAGEDRHRRGHSRPHEAGIPEPPGAGRGRCHAGGKAEQLARRPHPQLPGRSKDGAAGEEPLEAETHRLFSARAECRAPSGTTAQLHFSSAAFRVRFLCMSHST